MNKLKFLFIPFCLILFYCIIPTFTSPSYSQIFEVDEEDYFGSLAATAAAQKEKDDENEDGKTNTDSKDSSAATTNSEDSDKETCLDNNQIESAAVLSSDSDTNSDSYTSNFHFIKNLIRMVIL